jgi:hypothetical protein
VTRSNPAPVAIAILFTVVGATLIVLGFTVIPKVEVPDGGTGFDSGIILDVIAFFLISPRGSSTCGTRPGTDANDATRWWAYRANFRSRRAGTTRRWSAPLSAKAGRGVARSRQRFSGSPTGA